MKKYPLGPAKPELFPLGEQEGQKAVAQHTLKGAGRQVNHAIFRGHGGLGVHCLKVPTSSVPAIPVRLLSVGSEGSRTLGDAAVGTPGHAPNYSLLPDKARRSFA